MARAGSPEKEYQSPPPMPEGSLLDDAGLDTSPPSDNITDREILPTAQEGTPLEPKYSETGLRIPATIKGIPTNEQEKEIHRLIGAGIDSISASKRVMGNDYVPASPPDSLQSRGKPRTIEIDKRKLGPNQKDMADGDKRVESFYPNENLDERIT